MVDFELKKILWNICLDHANLPITLLGDLHLRITYHSAHRRMTDLSECCADQPNGLAGRNNSTSLTTP